MAQGACQGSACNSDGSSFAANRCSVAAQPAARRLLAAANSIAPRTCSKADRGAIGSGRPRAGCVIIIGDSGNPRKWRGGSEDIEKGGEVYVTSSGPSIGFL